MWFVGYDHFVYALNCEGCDSRRRGCETIVEGGHFIVSLEVAFESSYEKGVHYLVIR